MEYWFWTLVYSLILIWYIAVTLIVAFKGWGNIRDMIDFLKKK